MGAAKKNKYLIYIALFFIFIILCLFHKEIKCINNVKPVLESTVSDVKSLFDIVLVPGGLKSPFVLEYKAEGNKNINSITFFNNKKESYMCLGIDGKIKLNVFSHNNKLGIYTSNTPEVCYTASSKKFTSDWNNSIYGKILKIPDFVPENLSYKKINSFLNSKKIMNASVALGLGKDKMNLNELKKNISVSLMGTYHKVLPEKKAAVSVIRVSVPKKNVINCISQNIDISDNSYKGFAVDFLNNIKRMLENANEDKINIDLFVCNRKLSEAKLTFDSKTYIFSNSKSDLNFTIGDSESENTLFQLNIDKHSENYLTAQIKAGKTYILKVNKTDFNNICFKLDDAQSKQVKFKLTYIPCTFDPDIKYKERNIYTLSLYELVCVIRDITKKSSA